MGWINIFNCFCHKGWHQAFDSVSYEPLQSLGAKNEMPEGQVVGGCWGGWMHLEFTDKFFKNVVQPTTLSKQTFSGTDHSLQASVAFTLLGSACQLTTG